VGSFERAAAGFHDLGDAQWEGLARSNLAEAFLEQGDARQALGILRPLPELFRGLREPAYEGNSLWLLSWTHRLLGETGPARSSIDAALLIADDAANRVWEALWLIEAARLHLAQGDTAEAMRCCRMAASLERQIGDPSREASALDCTGEVLQAMANVQDAAAFHLQAARMHQELADSWQEALALIHLAACEDALGRGELSRAHRATAISRLRAFPDARAARLRRGLESSAP
jgi:tetratricopeptide (TPR) repeat protein